MAVVIACDPHKHQVTVAVLNSHRKVLERGVFPMNRVGLRQLENFARRCPERRWAVEGAGGAGAALAQRLVAEESESFPTS